MSLGKVLLHLHNNNVITKVVQGEMNLKDHADCMEQPVLQKTSNVLEESLLVILPEYSEVCAKVFSG